MSKNQNCEVCYKIKCRNCGWEPDQNELSEIAKESLRICPDCGLAK